jgi:hypothetical protein
MSMRPLELDSDKLVPLSRNTSPPSVTDPSPPEICTAPPLEPDPDDKVNTPPSPNAAPTDSAMLPDKAFELPVESTRDPAASPAFPDDIETSPLFSFASAVTNETLSPPRTDTDLPDTTIEPPSPVPSGESREEPEETDTSPPDSPEPPTIETLPPLAAPLSPPAINTTPPPSANP